MFALHEVENFIVESRAERGWDDYRDFIIMFYAVLIIITAIFKHPGVKFEILNLISMKGNIPEVKRDFFLHNNFLFFQTDLTSLQLQSISDESTQRNQFARGGKTWNHPSLRGMVIDGLSDVYLHKLYFIFNVPQSFPTDDDATK